MPDYEDLILQRQENLEIWEDGEAWEDDEAFDDLFPEIALDFDDIDLSLGEY